MVGGLLGDHGARAQDFVAEDHRQEPEDATTLLQGMEEPIVGVVVLRLGDAVLIIVQVG